MKYSEIQVLAEDTISNKRYFQIWEIMRKKQTEPFKVADIIVNKGSTNSKNKGPKPLSVTMIGGRYRCEIHAKPFMSLETCHSW